MRLFAILFNVALLLFGLYFISNGGFQNHPRDIFLQFLLLVTPVLNLVAFFGRKDHEKWMM